MPVPKRKVSKRRRDQRSANKGIAEGSFCACQTCQAPLSLHQACSECGYYKGKKVLKTKTDRMHKRAETAKLKGEQIAATQKVKEVPEAEVEEKK